MSHLQHHSLPALTRNTTTLFPSCLQHSVPPTVHSRVCFLPEPTPFNPNHSHHYGGKGFTARCSPVQKVALLVVFRLHEPFQSLLQPFGSATGIQSQPQAIQNKQAHQSPNKALLIETESRLHLAWWFSHLTSSTPLFRFPDPALTLMPQVTAG